MNKHENPADIALGSKARRVVRGGSWSGNREDARCADRVGNISANRGGYVGFRVVRVGQSVKARAMPR